MERKPSMTIKFFSDQITVEDYKGSEKKWNVKIMHDDYYKDHFLQEIDGRIQDHLDDILG